jgi:hypothetical protein
MPRYCHSRDTINTTIPFLVLTQATNLALLVRPSLESAPGAYLSWPEPIPHRRSAEPPLPSTFFCIA